MRYTRFSSTRDPELPPTVVPVHPPQRKQSPPPQCLRKNTHDGRSRNMNVPVPAATNTGSAGFLASPPALSGSSLSSGYSSANLCDSLSLSGSFGRKALSPCSTASKMSVLFKPGSAVPISNNRPNKLRFSCPKPTKNENLTSPSNAHHSRTPPAQVLRQQECFYNMQIHSMSDYDEDEDEYYNDNEGDDKDDEYENYYFGLAWDEDGFAMKPKRS